MRQIPWKMFALAVVLSACTQTSKWTVNDRNFYWSTSAVTEENPTANSHVLLVVDDSGSMSTLVARLRSSLPTLVQKLKNAKVKHYIHMLRMSQLDVDVLETQGRIALPKYVTSGETEVRSDIANLVANDATSKEYGVALMAGMVKKLFPQLSEINAIETLMPIRYNGPGFTRDQLSVLNQFFQLIPDGQRQPISIETILSNDLEERANNLQAILNNYDYYLYPYLRDQALNQRVLNYVYPLVLSDEDDEGGNTVGTVAGEGGTVVLSGTADSFLYEYERTFVRTSKVLGRDLCVYNNNSSGLNLHAYSGYNYGTHGGPSSSAGYLCVAANNGGAIQSSWDPGYVTGNSGYRLCSVPNSYDCRPLDAELRVGAPQRINGASPYGLWASYYPNSADFAAGRICDTSQGARVGYTCIKEGGAHGAWVTAEGWNIPTAANGSIKYNEVCTAVPGTGITKLLVPNGANRPLWNFPGVTNCNPVQCNLEAVPGLRGTLANGTLTVAQIACPADYTRFTGGSVAWVDISNGIFDGASTTVAALPANAVVKHYLVKARGKFRSPTWLTPEEAKAAIASLHATEVRDGNGLYSGGSGSQEFYAGAVESNTYEQTSYVILKSPAEPNATGEALFSNADGFKTWTEQNFGDLDIHVSAIVKQNTSPCPAQSGVSGAAEPGTAYMALADLTDGIKQDICAMGTATAFDTFMDKLGDQIIEGNEQSIQLQGPRDQGVFEVRDVTPGFNNILLENVHWRWQAGGAHGFVVLFRGAVPANHTVQVSVLRN